MSQQLRKTVWLDWAEWALMFDALYSQHSNQQCLGIRRLETWRARGRVPLSIETTGSLVELDLLARCRVVSQWHLRLMYSMIIIRFVNGVIDPRRQGAARSINSLAAELDLPRVFVDLRHQATHNMLPPLSLLELAAERVKLWVLSHYWQPQADAIKSLQSGRPLLQLLKRYKILAKSPATEEGALKICMNEIMNVMSTKTAESVLVQTLLDPNSNHLLKLPKKSLSPTAARVSVVFVKQLRIWQPLLGTLASQQEALFVALLAEVVEQLAGLQSTEEPAALSTSHNNRQTWLSCLLSRWALNLTSVLKSTVGKGSLFERSAKLHAIARSCLLRNNPWFQAVLAELLPLLSLRPDRQKLLQKIYVLRLPGPANQPLTADASALSSSSLSGADLSSSAGTLPTATADLILRLRERDGSEQAMVGEPVQENAAAWVPCREMIAPLGTARGGSSDFLLSQSSQEPDSAATLHAVVYLEQEQKRGEPEIDVASELECWQSEAGFEVSETIDTLNVAPLEPTAGEPSSTFLAKRTRSTAESDTSSWTEDSESVLAHVAKRVRLLH
eukprot:gb/GEZN01001894.1/.p1 GENE.gb/GEZN01001894.1/~~gb/GEZN01001894.1/.p1  ORF type:complete len:560 (-),score=92.74 gb/GEZN01001894.1/:983-2662(-)